MTSRKLFAAALVAGAVAVAAPVSAQLLGGAGGAVGGTVGGMTHNANGALGAGVTTARPAAGVKGGINGTTQTSSTAPGEKAIRTANRATRNAERNTNAAEEETTRQLNQQQANINANGQAGASVQQ